MEDLRSTLVGGDGQMAAQLSCDAALVTLVEDDEGHPLSVGRKARKIPPALHRALRARDQGCRFPGCNQRRFVEGHHIQHWAAGGETSLENLVQLCWFHHRLLHEGGYRLEKESGGGLSFFRPNGTLIERVPPKGGPHNGKLTFDVDPDNTLSRWTGERMNYGYVTGGLALGDSRLRGQPSQPRKPEAEGDPPGG